MSPVQVCAFGLVNLGGEHVLSGHGQPDVPCVGHTLLEQVGGGADGLIAPPLGWDDRGVGQAHQTAVLIPGHSRVERFGHDLTADGLGEGGYRVGVVADQGRRDGQTAGVGPGQLPGLVLRAGDGPGVVDPASGQGLQDTPEAVSGLAFTPGQVRIGNLGREHEAARSPVIDGRDVVETDVVEIDVVERDHPGAAGFDRRGGGELDRKVRTKGAR